MDTTGSVFMPQAGSTIAGDVDALFYFIYWVSVVIFGIVVGAAALFILRYRRGEKAELTSGVSHNTPLEIVWTVIPLILVMIVFVWGFKSYMKMSIAPKDAIEIKVTAQRWFWNFDYPEGGNSIDELVVPVGKPVKLLMSSQDVIHSFFVPDFRVKMDVLPNRYTVAWFEAPRVGEYNLFCTEYCGTQHSEMTGKVRVLSAVDYQHWQEESVISGEGMTLEEYGRKIYNSKACFTCHSIDGSTGIGPTFKGIFGKKERLEDGSDILVDENYIRESILVPAAKVTAGYQPVMPTFQGLLTDRQIDALIAFIKSIQNSEGI